MLLSVQEERSMAPQFVRQTTVVLFLLHQILALHKLWVYKYKMGKIVGDQISNLRESNIVLNWPIDLLCSIKICIFMNSKKGNTMS